MALLTAHQCSVLLIDMQEKLLPAIADHEALLERVQRFIEGAKLCSVPVMATEHWPEKIGPTHPALLPHVESVIAKTHFDALREPAVRANLPTHRPKVLLLGAEAHICVLQTGLSLHQAGYHPILVLDGIGSRLSSSYEAACKRWQYHGLESVTMEMALFEWLETPAHPAFKSVLKLVK